MRAVIARLSKILGELGPELTFWLQVSPTSNGSESGQLERLDVLLDEVDHHLDQTVEVDRDEDPLQQFTQLTHGGALSDRPVGAQKRPRKWGPETKKARLERAFGKFRTSLPSSAKWCHRRGGESPRYAKALGARNEFIVATARRFPQAN